MYQISRSLHDIRSVLFLAAILYLFGGPAAANPASGDMYYTVQTGTYTPASLSFAKRHYKTLVKTLKESELSYLRIEEGTKYFIVRIGKFGTYDQAVPLLETVRNLVPDAFIVQQEDFTSIKYVEMYAKDTQPGIASPDQGLVEYYTVQLGNFLKLDQASEEFNSISGKIAEDDAASLRVEKADRYFSVRIGRFETYGAARKFISRYSDNLPGASILKSSPKDEQVLIAYGDPTLHAVITTEQTRPSIEQEESTRSEQDVEAERKKKELEDLFNDISAQYYGEQYGKAAEILRRGIEKYPDNADLHAWYGATLLNMRFSDKALEEYKRAAEISPDVPEFHAGMGHSLLNIYMDRARDSIASFQKALEIDPNNVSALEGLGFVYASIGKKDQAEAIHQQLLQLDPGAAARLNQAIVNGVDWEE